MEPTGSTGLKPLRLSDAPVIETFFRNLKRPLADVNLIVVLAWRKALRLEYLIENAVLYVFGMVGRKKVLWLPPLGSRDLNLLDVFRGLQLLRDNQSVKTNGIIRNVWEEYPLFPELQRNSDFLISTEAKEYVYQTSKITHLFGGAFKAKRADVRFFTREYRPEVFPYDVSAAQECLALLDEWLRQKRVRYDGPTFHKAVREYEVCKAALCDGFPLEGIVCRVGSRIVAFSLGVPHVDDSFNCVFEKADLTLRGCSAFVFSSLASNLEERFALINAGEDWGVPQLRLAKELWRPVLTRRIYQVIDRRA